jgi:hypothetical protein
MNANLKKNPKKTEPETRQAQKLSYNKKTNKHPTTNEVEVPCFSLGQ